MKAVRIHQHGGVDVLHIEDIPEPNPGPQEVVVNIKAAGMNHLDIWVRQGIPGVKFPLPITPGCDGAGVITAVGSHVSGVAVGDKTVLIPGTSCGLCELCLSGNDNLCRHYGIMGEAGNGTDCEFIVVPAANLLPFPQGMNFAEAAAIPLVFQTAWHMLVTRAQIRAGETVLIHAAGSGVGSAAIQIASLMGCRVITTAGSDDKLELARKLGANVTINYQKDDFATVVRTETRKAGVDVVFEHIGAAVWDKSLRCLKKGGRLVTCGATAGHEVQVNLRLVFFKLFSILGSTMGTKSELHTIMRLVNAGKLRPVLDRTFTIEEIQAAHTYLESRSNFGKVVLTV